MKLTELQYERIKDVMPRQRGNVRLANLDLLNAILYVAEKGCKWRDLPKEFGNWNTVYVRLNRWAKKGVLDRVFEALQQERLIHVKITVASLDSTIIKVHPDGTGALKKNGPQSIGKSRGGWTTKIHRVATNAVAPPLKKSNRLEPWEYDRELYKRRNEVERLFRKLKGFRRLATRDDKLDIRFLAFLVFPCIFLALK